MSSSGKSKRKVEVSRHDSGSVEDSRRKISVFQRLGRSTHHQEHQDRPPKCRNWENTGSCLYGSKCHFRHDGAPPEKDRKSRRSRSIEKVIDRREERRPPPQPPPQQHRSRDQNRGKRPETPPLHPSTDMVPDKAKPLPIQERDDNKAQQMAAAVAAAAAVLASKPGRFQPSADEEEDEQELLRKKRAIQYELKKLQDEAGVLAAIAVENDFAVDDGDVTSEFAKQQQRKTPPRGPCTPPPSQPSPPKSSPPGERLSSAESVLKQNARGSVPRASMPLQSAAELAAMSLPKQSTTKRPLPDPGSEERASKAKKRRYTPPIDKGSGAGGSGEPGAAKQQSAVELVRDRKIDQRSRSGDGDTEAGKSSRRPSRVPASDAHNPNRQAAPSPTGPKSDSLMQRIEKNGTRSDHRPTSSSAVNASSSRTPARHAVDAVRQKAVESGSPRSSQVSPPQSATDKTVSQRTSSSQISGVQVKRAPSLLAEKSKTSPSPARAVAKVSSVVKEASAAGQSTLSAVKETLKSTLSPAKKAGASGKASHHQPSKLKARHHQEKLPDKTTSQTVSKPKRRTPTSSRVATDSVKASVRQNVDGADKDLPSSVGLSRLAPLRDASPEATLLRGGEKARSLERGWQSPPSGSERGSRKKNSPTRTSPGSPSRQRPHTPSTPSPRPSRARSTSADSCLKPRALSHDNPGKDSRLQNSDSDHYSSRGQRRHPESANKDKYEDYAHFDYKREEGRRSRGKSRSPYKGKQRANKHQPQSSRDSRHSPLPPPPAQLLFPPLPQFYPLPHRDGNRSLSPHSFSLLPPPPFGVEFFKQERFPYDDRLSSNSRGRKSGDDVRGSPRSGHSQSPLGASGSRRRPHSPLSALTLQLKDGRSLPLPPLSRYKERQHSESFRDGRSPPSSLPGRRRDSSYHRDKDRPLSPPSDYRSHSPRERLRLLLPSLPKELRDLSLLLPPAPESYRRERDRHTSSGELKAKYSSDRKAAHSKVYSHPPAKYDSPQDHIDVDRNYARGRMMPVPLPPPSYHEGPRGDMPYSPESQYRRRPLPGDDGLVEKHTFGGPPPRTGRDGEPSRLIRGRGGRLRGGRGGALGRDDGHGRRPIAAAANDRHAKDGDKFMEGFRGNDDSRMQSQSRKRPRSPISGTSSDRKISMSPPRQRRIEDSHLSPRDRQQSDGRSDEKNIIARKLPRLHGNDQASFSDREPAQKRRRMDPERQGGGPKRASGEAVRDTGRKADRFSGADAATSGTHRDRGRGWRSPSKQLSETMQDRRQNDVGSTSLSPRSGRNWSRNKSPDTSHQSVSAAPSSGASPAKLCGSTNGAPSDDDLDNLIASQQDAEKDEQETKTFATATAADVVDIDWSSMMGPTEGTVASPESAVADQRSEPSSSVLSLFSPASILTRIGVSRAYAGNERFQMALDLISEANPKDGCGKLLDDVPLLHVRKRLEKASRQALLADMGPGKKALSARKDLAIRRKVAGPVKSAIVAASRSSFGAVDRDLVKLSLQLFAAEPIQIKSSLSDIEVQT